MEKLKVYDIVDPLFSMLKNHMSSRQQQVNLNGWLSSLKSVEYGVPQGNILGPLFFII